MRESTSTLARAHGGLEAPGPHQLHRAQAEHRGARVRGERRAALDEQAGTSWRASSIGGGQPGGAGADDQDGGLGCGGAWRDRAAARVRAHEQRLLNSRPAMQTPRHGVAARLRHAEAELRRRRRGAGGGRGAAGVVVAGPAGVGKTRLAPRPRSSPSAGCAVAWVRRHALGGVDPARRVRAAAAGRSRPAGGRGAAGPRAPRAGRARRRAPARAVRRRRPAARRRVGGARAPARGRGRGVRRRDRAPRRAGAGCAAGAVEGRAVRAARAGRARARARSSALLDAGARRPGRRRAASTRCGS